MSSTICNDCRLALRRTLLTSRPSRQQRAAKSTVSATLSRPPDPIDTTTPDLASLLSQPTWSVRSLLPSSSPSPSEATTITSKTLHHLLRLSALPLPQTPEEESEMLATLSSQLHFVRAIQGVDTTGVAPLRVIRDETAEGLREQTIGLAQLQEALGAEDVVGHARRPRRRRGTSQEQEQMPTKDDGNRGVLRGASETAGGGRYFVVRSGGTAKKSNGDSG
ncbi:hypothetical protein F4803DRAFT_26137 [Xylaria telfairii]|nr:hypothetical protein F4803DRAFT_26137 [Xylaria telfairii]